MKHKLLFLFILLFSSTAFSQLQLELDVVVSDFKSSKKESGATMKVYEGTKVVGTATSGSNGKVTLKVPANKVYKVEISKAGKVTRYFNVNSKNIDIELLQGASEPVVRTTVALFDKTVNVDYNFIQSNPITEFYFDGKSTVLAFNKATSDKMDKKVEEVIANADKTDGNNEVQYQAKMKDGEALAAAGNYSEALTKFEQASMFKKNDKTAINRMDAMDKLIKADKISQIDGQVAGGAYDNLIAAAKTLKGQKKYQLAIDKYEEALDVKRNDQFALDEIDALMVIIQKEKREKENESAYAAAMTTGETLLKQKSYQAARDQYDIALKAKPGDAEATKKKNEVLGFLDAAKGAIEKKKNFDAAILAGDQLFKAEKWADAKVKYDEALELEAASTYAKGQNDLIKAKLEGIEKAKAMQVQIDQLIADGNKAFTAEKWEEAKTKFTEVKKLDDKNAVATEKLNAIQLKIDELKKNAELEAKFKKLVDEGDLAIKGSKFEDGIAKYKGALELKANTEVEQKKTDAETAFNKLKSQKELKANFDLAMKEGEALLVANKLEEAKAKFTEASTLDETAQLPKDKIKAIDEKILATKSAKEKEEQFNAAMTSASTLRSAGKFDEAILEYKKAQAIDKTKTEPAAKIKDIEAEVLTLAANKSAGEKAEKFNAAMEAGNTLRASGKLEEAIAEYKKAQGIDATKTEPAKKISEVQTEITTLAANKSAGEKAEKFNAAMEAGNTLRASGKLEEAIAEYKKAQGIDATKTEPAKKISEVQTEITTLAANKSAGEKAEKFNAAMEAGNTLRASGKLEEAIAEYKKAQGIDATKTEPATKISEVQTEITTLANNKSAGLKAEKFNAAMEAGNTLRASGKLEEAIAEYKKAQGIDATKTEPATKISEVQTEITTLANNKSAGEKAEKFNAAMEKGNSLRATGKLEEAIAEYKKAQGIDATKTEPATKISEVQTEISTLLANKSAGEKAEKFNAAMEKGNSLRATGKLEEAIAEYKKAQGIDATKPEPATKISELQEEISSLAANRSAGEKTEKYNAAMSAGNSLRIAGKLEAAIVEYKKAQGIDNTKPEPELIIKQVQDEITALANNKSAKDKENQYNAAMTAGNALRSAGKLEGAITEYKKAQVIDGTKTEPADKITEVQNEIASKAINSDDVAYTELMTAAATLEDSKNYKQAIEKYNAAKALKPTEKKPAERIKALELMMKDLEAQVLVDAKYNEALKKGNDAMGEEDYLAAIKHFNAANKIKPNETEPVDKARIAEEMSKNKTSEEDNLFEKMLLFAKQKIDEKDFVKAEELIKRAKDNRPTDPRPTQLQKELDKQIKDRKDFQAKMTNAKEAFDKKNYDEALKLYREAKVIMPNDTKPDEGILAAQREKSLLENSAQEDEIYLATIKKAETAVSEKNYTVAIEEYKKAAAMKPTDKTIDGKIVAIKKIMTDLASAATKQVEKVKFDGLVAQADNLFESSKWNDAKAKYEQANAVIANDPHVLNQIQKCTSNADKNQNELAKYKQLIIDADKKYNAGSYQHAKELYQSALKMSNSDSYPHSQLAKIDGVLNPVFADDGALPNLGTPTDNSLMEGQALLERAAKVRAHRSSTQFRDKDKDMDDLSVESTKSKTDENQAISIALKNKMEVQELVDVNKDDWRKTVVDSVRFATSEVERRDKESDNYDNFEGQEARRLVTQITTDNEEKFNVKHQVFAENTAKVNKTVISEQDNLMAKSQSLYNQQIDTKGAFTRIEIEVEENYIDDLDDRKLVVDSVRNAQRSLDIAGNEQSQRVIDKSISIKSEVDQSNLIRQSKDVQSDESRQAVVEVVKAKQTQVAGIEKDKQDASYQKSLNTKQDVTNKIKAIDVENQLYKDNQDEKIAELVSTEKKVVEITTQHQGNDDASRQKSKELITNHVQQVEEITEKGSKSPEENQVVMKESIGLTSERQNKAEEGQVQKNYEARKFVEDITDKKLAYSEKVANEIGAKYPEGVSQETFQKNGTDGLPVAFITRRVVVRNGHGDVYVRTQTLQAITYSKNGDPSSEYIWQKETSDAKLTRNY